MGLVGSSVTQPIEKESWPSKIGSKVVPLFSVRHTPPEDTAMNQREVSLGSIARSPMSPPGKKIGLTTKVSVEKATLPAGRSSTAWSRATGSKGAWGFPNGVDFVRLPISEVGEVWPLVRP